MNELYQSRSNILQPEKPVEKKEQTNPALDKALWAASGVDISLNRLESIQKSFLKAAELFRETDMAVANRLFIQCLDGLERFFEALVATKVARELDFKLIRVNDNETLQGLETQLLEILRSTMVLQEALDYTAISDKIEYELITNLFSWNGALRKLRISFNSNA